MLICQFLDCQVLLVCLQYHCWQLLLDTQSSEVCLSAKEERSDGRVSQSDWMIAVPSVIGSFEGAKNKQNQKSDPPIPMLVPAPSLVTTPSLVLARSLDPAPLLVQIPFSGPILRQHIELHCFAMVRTLSDRIIKCCDPTYKFNLHSVHVRCFLV